MMLRISELIVDYRGRSGSSRALHGVSLVVPPATICALVGESGSGKSTVAAAVGRLPVPGLTQLSGTIALDGRHVESASEAELAAIRRETLGYIFQDPVASLDPTMKVGRQLALAAGLIGAAAIGALADLGIREPERTLASFPHEISGGMAQRVAIAIAMGRRPRLIVADEPTAALDASVRRQVMDLLVAQCRAAGAAMLLVTHDLEIVRRYADLVAVMHAGRVVETGPAASVLADPSALYTKALLASTIGHEQPGERIRPMEVAP
jgi:ABC-type dipeptide/oligopeptide/nickel transport system ATPase component